METVSVLEAAWVAAGTATVVNMSLPWIVTICRSDVCESPVPAERATVVSMGPRWIVTAARPVPADAATVVYVGSTWIATRPGTSEVVIVGTSVVGRGRNVLRESSCAHRQRQKRGWELHLGCVVKRLEILYDSDGYMVVEGRENRSAGIRAPNGGYIGSS